MKRARLLGALFLGACACSRAPAPTPTPAPAATLDASAAVDACANLTLLGCAVGRDPACADRLDLGVRQHHVPLAAALCARVAPSRAALAGCGPYFACAP